MTTLRDLLASGVRTVVPYLVGLALTRLAVHFDFVLSDETSANVTAAAVVLAGSGYYALVRLAEKRWPKVGLLLGWNVPPLYAKNAQAG